MDDGKPGEVWKDNQNDLIVAEYFEMLSFELSGRPYVKSHRNSALQGVTGRSRGSIERKHMNISAVMERLGLPRIKGYVPYPNFQTGLIDAVERYFIEKGLPEFDKSSYLEGQVRKETILLVGPPPTRPSNELERSTSLERLVRKFDPAARDARNRSLGKAGEELVLANEIRRLGESGRGDLAQRVEWTSQERGDGAGYDISSFEIDGQPRLIEVKTTNGAGLTPFYLTENERLFSEEQPYAFKLLRLYNFSEKPMAYELCPPLHITLALSPINYRAVPI